MWSTGPELAGAEAAANSRGGGSLLEEAGFAPLTLGTRALPGRAPIGTTAAGGAWGVGSGAFESV